MKIEWYPICGYEGLYEWSPTTEAVRGLKSCIVLKWYYDKQGRPCVKLYKNGKARNFYMAMIIYSHTHQCEIPLGYDVHHINGCWTNNDPSNLQLLTHEEHARLHGKAWTNDPKRSKAVVAIDEHNRIVHRFASTQEAERNGFNSGCVSCAARGCYNCKSDPHLYKGYYWYYEDEWLAMQHKPLIQQDGQLLLAFQ